MKQINLKSILTGVTLALALIGSPVAMAKPGDYCDHMKMSSEKMHDPMKARMDKLADRLEIKASQQAVWEEFAKSIEKLAEHNMKMPNEDADATAISRYHADKASDVASKLAAIANATAKLQKVLNVDQRKILNQAAHHFLQHSHGGHFEGHESADEMPDTATQDESAAHSEQGKNE